MRYRDALAQGSARLAAAGVANAALDARLLLQQVAQIDHAALISCMADSAPAETVGAYEALLERRVAGEPVSRIIGRREFFGLQFKVTAAVLDPRPETEILVERVLEDHPDRTAPLFFADIGTGSGAIAVALLVNLVASRCVASDISAQALEIAKANARTHGVEARAEFVRADFLADPGEGLAGPFDFIVSNPPYVASGDIAGLAPEVRAHDPHVALDGGSDGLDAYRALLTRAGDRLKPGGRLYLEMGAGQAGRLRRLAQASGWTVPEVVGDLAGIERVLVAAT